MHSIHLENEGLTSCYALVCVLGQGKTNQFGRIDFGAFIRSKDVRLCPFGATGFYLFWRYYVEGEPWPCFDKSQDWFNIKFLKSGKDPTKALDYRTHKSSIDCAFKEIGILSKAKTHAARGSGARMAELGGASEDHIRRLGRWNNNSMDNCYLTNLPREAMRALAGFSPERGCFFLDRAALEPSLALKRLLFPELERTLQKIVSGQCQDTIAARGFLELLDRMRTVVLQDSVLMISEHPQHPIWKHEIFSSDLYRIFAQNLKQSFQTSSDPAETVLQKAMPALSEKLGAIHSDLKSTFSTQIAPISKDVAKLQDQISDFFSGKVPIAINADFGALRSQPADSENNQVSGATLAAPVAENPMIYKLSRGIQTVTDLWREWTSGVAGGPAVKDLELRWGAKWCQGNERRFFSRRKQIVDEVLRKAKSMQGGETSENCFAAAQLIEERRKQQKKSLDWLSKHIERF